MPIIWSRVTKIAGWAETRRHFEACSVVLACVTPSQSSRLYLPRYEVSLIAWPNSADPHGVPPPPLPPPLPPPPGVWAVPADLSVLSLFLSLAPPPQPASGEPAEEGQEGHTRARAIIQVTASTATLCCLSPPASLSLSPTDPCTQTYIPL